MVHTVEDRVDGPINNSNWKEVINTKVINEKVGAVS